MPYRAERQNLFGNVGAPTPPSTGIDYAGILDSLTNAGTSFIHQAMLRRQAENATAIAADQRAYQRGRDQVEDARHEQERADRLTHENDDLELRKEAERHRFIEQGGIPEHTEMTPVPTTASVPAPVSPIGQAMMAPQAKKGGPPGRPGFMPSGAPALPASLPLPASTIAPTTVPESYDPRKSREYVQATDAAGVRAQVQGDLQAQRLAAQQAGREYAAGQAQQLARLHAQLTADAKKNSPVGKAMTGNMLEGAAQKTAEGLLDQFGGSYDDAYDFLMSTKEGKDLRDFGVQPRHLTAARSKWTRDATGQAIRLQTSGFMEPDSAVAAVRSTRQLLGGGAKKGTPIETGEPDALKPPVAKPEATKSAPSSKPDAETSMSDADLWEFKVKNGMSKGEATAYVNKRKRGGAK